MFPYLISLWPYITIDRPCLWLAQKRIRKFLMLDLMLTAMPLLWHCWYRLQYVHLHWLMLALFQSVVWHLRLVFSASYFKRLLLQHNCSNCIILLWLCWPQIVNLFTHWDTLHTLQYRLLAVDRQCISYEHQVFICSCISNGPLTLVFISDLLSSLFALCLTTSSFKIPL